MATKRQIKQAVFEEVRQASQAVDTETQVVVSDVDVSEQLPAVSYDIFPQGDPVGVGNFLSEVTRNEDGERIETYADIERYRIELTAIAETQQKADRIEESIIRRLNRFDMLDEPQDLQEDIRRLTIAEADSIVPDRAEVVRGERLQINLDFRREQEFNRSE